MGKSNNNSSNNNNGSSTKKTPKKRQTTTKTPITNTKKKKRNLPKEYFKVSQLPPEDRVLREKLVQQIVDKKEKKQGKQDTERVPHGWLERKLKKDPDGLYTRLGITQRAVRNEVVRRSRLRQRGLLANPNNKNNNDDDNDKTEASTEQTPIAIENDNNFKRQGQPANKSSGAVDEETTIALPEVATDDEEEEAPRAKRKRKRQSNNTQPKKKKKPQQKKPQRKNQQKTKKTEVVSKEAEVEENESDSDSDSDSDTDLDLDTKPIPKMKLPRRSKSFRNGTVKPPEYRQAYEDLDRIEVHRKKFVAKTDEKQKRVDKIKEELAEAMADLQSSQDRLAEYDKTVVQPAKDRLVELELSIDLPWTRRYHQLVAYKEQHGNLRNLPSRCPEDKELDNLCRWVGRQRQRRRKAEQGKNQVLRPYQLELLDKIGFEWDMKDKGQKHFDNLLKFKDHFGHCMVPQHYHDKKLANWVYFQRQEMNLLKRDGQCTNLNPERIKKLDQVGFVWNVFDLKWNQIYDKLKNFHSKYGHCRVPKSYREDQELANWVRKQREQYVLYQDETQRKSRKCKMKAEKIEKLEALGFEWTEPMGLGGDTVLQIETPAVDDAPLLQPTVQVNDNRTQLLQDALEVMPI